jgi:hypothetical protein
MKKQKSFVAFLSVAFLLFTLLFGLTGCRDFFQEPETQADTAVDPGTGRITIDLADDESGSRTLLPQAPVFSFYVLSFHYTDGGVTEAAKTVYTFPCAVDLIPGEWTVTVSAYITVTGISGMSDGDFLAATGSVTKTVSAGASVQIAVDLHSGVSAGGRGVLSYRIGLPSEGLHGASLRVLAPDKTEIALKDLTESASGTITLDAGYYLLQVTALTGRVRSKTELIHIYGGQTTEASGAPYNFNIEEGVYLSAEELSDFLASAPSNTAANPYAVKLNVNLASLESSGDSLRLLFEALHGKYVSLDLSDSTGNIGIGNISGRTGNDKLVSLVFPTGLTSIGGGAFSDCTSLKSIRFPNSYLLETIGGSAFENCSSLESVIFPAALKTIGVWAFFNCTSLESIDLSECMYLTAIYDNTFRGCSSLNAVSLPPSLQTIGEYVFEACESLEEIEFPSSLQSIGVYAFSAAGLKRVDFSQCAGMQILDQVVFDGCSNLEDVILPPNITTIRSSCFRNCVSLSEIALPATLTSLASSAFMGCANLVSFNTSASSVFTTAGGGALLCNSAGTILLSWPSASGTIQLPAGITEIGSYAFIGTTITTVDFSNSSLIKINDTAFSDDYITSINLSGCNALTTIGTHAFFFIGETAITVTITNAAPPSLGSVPFCYMVFYTDGFDYVIQQDLSIKVPAALVDTYKTAAGWSVYADKITALP